MGQKPVVILVHGIRDYALWQNSVRIALEDAGFKVEATNYGRLNLIEFLLPVSFFRRKAIETIWRQVRIVKQRHPQSPLSVIAHSFGTYVVAHLMKENFDITFDRVIFCGSVVTYKFEFEQIQNRFTPDLMNEVGTRDVWPAVAESVTFGYGSAGTYGFRRPLVRDRWHNGAHHGFFLKPGFCTEFWVPFLRDGTVVRGADEPEAPKLWLQILSIVKIKYLLIAGAVALAVHVGSMIAQAECDTDVTAEQVTRLEASVDTNLRVFPSHALRDAMALAEACPRRPNAWRQLGRVRYALAQYGDAFYAFDRGVKLKPTGDLWAKLMIGRGAALINLHRYEEAQKVLAEVSDTYPNEDLAWKNLAVTRVHLGNPGAAKKGFLQQYDVAATSAERAFASMGLGIAEAQLGNAGAGVKYFGRAVCTLPALKGFLLQDERVYVDGWNFETFRELLKSFRGQEPYDDFLDRLATGLTC